MFRGTGTAVVTPFSGGAVDYESFGRFLNWQIESRVKFLVVLGTTGKPHGDWQGSGRRL